MKNIKTSILKKNEGNLVIEGDFNARVEEEKTIIWGNDRDKLGRKSKDKIVNVESKIFLEEIGERGSNILNGNIEGDGDSEIL
ncbi:hypothetical protein P5V15_011360 [Pogonomyrmex californicus]